VVVGTVVAPHGLRGEVRVLPETDFPERLAHLGTATLVLPDGRLRELAVVGGRWHTAKGAVLLRFAECTCRTEAEALRGARIVVHPGESPALPEGEYYDWQIVGLRAVTTDGQEIGTVREVIHTPANDVYATEEHLLPAIADVVKQIDPAAGRLIIEPLPGLLGTDSDE
jgi:16S rRNA processing protein RimM